MTEAAANVPLKDEPSAPPKPRVRWFFLGGLGMVAAGAALLYFFVADPTGTLPGFPQVWKGGPLLLGACFLGVYGALLLILKRFSLASMLLSIILSASLTGGVHAYVYSFRESETRKDSFYLPPKNLKALLERSRTSLTSTRVTAFVLDLYAAGHLKQAIDYDELEITYGADQENESEQLLILKFSWSPYVHPKRSQARMWAQSYAELANEWNVLRAMGVEPKVERCIPKSVYTVREILSWKSGFRIEFSFANSLCIFADNWAFLQRNSTQKKSTDQLYLEGYTWLAEREPDAELKVFLEQVRDEIKRGREKKPAAPKTALPQWPTKTSDEIEFDTTE